MESEVASTRKEMEGLKKALAHADAQAEKMQREHEHLLQFHGWDMMLNLVYLGWRQNMYRRNNNNNNNNNKNNNYNNYNNNNNNNNNKQKQ